MLYRVIVDGRNYTITYRDKYFILQDDDAPFGEPCKKVIPVDDNSEFTYKILKRKFKAHNGAAGLFSFVVDCYRNHFMECHADKIIRAAAAMK